VFFNIQTTGQTGLNRAKFGNQPEFGFFRSNLIARLH